MSEEYVTLRRSIAIIPKVGGVLSIAGSSAIVRDVSLKWREKKSVPLSSLLMFCISVLDCVGSFFCAFMSTWMVPRDSGWHLYTAGNTQTCTAQGFIWAFTSTASMNYYTLLMVLFWLIVQYGWNDSRLNKQSMRLLCVILPSIIALGMATPPLFWTMYNPGPMMCFIAPKPFDCEGNPKVECARGQGALVYWDIYWVYCTVCTIIIVVSVCLLVCSVFKQERKTDKYLSSGQQKRREMTRKTFWQGIRYVAAFVFAYFGVYTFGFYTMLDKWPPIPAFYAAIILGPLWGFFNAFAYFRPRYLAYREKNPSASRMKSLGNVFNIELDSVERDSPGNSGDNDSDDNIASPLFQHGEESTRDSTVI